MLFPGESHGLSRGGTPSRRLARLHIMRDWFHRHLVDGSSKKTEAKSEAAMAAVR